LIYFEDTGSRPKITFHITLTDGLSTCTSASPHKFDLIEILYVLSACCLLFPYKDGRRYVITGTLKMQQWKNEKKRSEETQTLRAGCSKAEPKKFAPPQTPFPYDGQNLISWRWSLPLPTNPVW